MPGEMRMRMIRMKYISVFRKIIGMRLRTSFSVQVYNNKADYRKNSLIISAVLALLGGVATYFISGHALRPIREFSDKIEEVQAQNLADSRLDENKVKELNQMSVSYNKMLGRLSDAFEIQRQFTANAAHELRTPLALMQVQLDSYNSGPTPGSAMPKPYRRSDGYGTKRQTQQDGEDAPRHE